MVDVAIGLGLVINLLFLEFTGLMAGGMVVPGYLALEIDNPFKTATTLFVGIATYQTTRLFSHHMIIYGARRMALMIIVGFLYGLIARGFITLRLDILEVDIIESIGLIVPGLIANCIERQGTLKTVCPLLIAAVMVRLILIIITEGMVWT